MWKSSGQMTCILMALKWVVYCVPQHIGQRSLMLVLVNCLILLMCDLYKLVLCSFIGILLVLLLHPFIFPKCSISLVTLSGHAENFCALLAFLYLTYLLCWAQIFWVAINISSGLEPETWRITLFFHYIFSGIGLNVGNEKPTTCLNAALRRLAASSSYQLYREDIMAAFFNKFENLYSMFLEKGNFSSFSPCIFILLWKHSFTCYLIFLFHVDHKSLQL